MSRKLNYAEKKAIRLLALKDQREEAGRHFLKAQEALGIPVTASCQRQVISDTEDTYYLDVSYKNADLKFTGDGLIRQAIVAEKGDVDFTGQDLSNNVRTITCAVLGLDRTKRLAEKLCAQGMEVIIFTPEKTGEAHLPIRCRSTNHRFGDDAKPCIAILEN
jgi:hypothetical protein